MDKIEAKTTHYSNNSISISKSWSFFNVSSQIDRAFMGETFKQQPVCRACNTDEISINNILIKPCDCRSYIHLQCYRNELKKKMKMEILNDSVVIIENASLGCEKCGGKSLIVMSFCNYKKDLMELGLFGEYVIFEKNDGKTVVVDLERHKDIFIVIFLRKNKKINIFLMRFFFILTFFHIRVVQKNVFFALKTPAFQKFIVESPGLKQA